MPKLHTPWLRKINTILVDRGFVLQSSYKERYFIYHGYIVFQDRNIRIMLKISKSELITFPYIYLLDGVPAEIPRPHPHVFSSDGSLCYVNRSLAYPDIRHPEGTILGALKLAEKVMSDLASGKLREDLFLEADIFWSSTKYLIDLESMPVAGAYCEQITLLSFSTNIMDFDTPSGWATFNPEATKNSFSAMLKKANKSEYKAFVSGIFVECKLPVFPEKKIANLNQLVNWLKPQFKDAIDHLYKTINDARKVGGSDFIFNVHAENLTIGVKFYVPAKGYCMVKKVPHDLRNSLWASHCKIKRCLPVDISARTWVRRSLPGHVSDSKPGLLGQKIAVLGCGSVGGYVCDFLAKMGAGQGGGELVVSDPDVLEPGNIGRHFLGTNYLYEIKGKAISEDLKLRYPGIAVKFSLDVDVLKQHEDYGLIIDATGNLTFSQYLSSKKAKGDIKPDILFSWVVGHGLGAQCYRQTNEGCCLVCVDYREPGGEFCIIPAGYEVEPRNTSNRCSDWHVPFSIASVASCASLTADMAVNQNLPFRSLNLSPDAIKIDDGTPTAENECLICNR